MDAEALLLAVRERVDARLGELLPPEDVQPGDLHRAMRYGCLASGKRIRPALCLASAEAVGGRFEEALDAACALEMVHAFSLIHDDLPAIDDDPVRRGAPSSHVEFGEALAILAGDALFALAFQTVASSSPKPDRAVAATLLLAEATGSGGLVGGEVMDVLCEGKAVSPEAVQAIHLRKTAALVAASCEIGGRLAGCDSTQASALRSFGRHVGLAFQISDDVLNATATPEDLGKPAGSDLARSKATYPSVHGIEASKAVARLEVEKAFAALTEAKLLTAKLEALAMYAVERER